MAPVRALSLALTFCALPALAAANGMRVGEGRAHFGLELETGYDSAVVATVAIQSVPSSDLVLRYRPQMRLDLPSPSLSLALSWRLDYNQYAGLAVASTEELNFLGAEAGVTLTVDRSGPLSLEIAERLVRSDQTANVAVGFGVLSLRNELTPKFIVRPGGGALQFDASYTHILELHTDRTIGGNPGALAGADYQVHRFKLESRWRFYPKTALVLDTSIDLRRYGAPGNTEMNPLRLLVGVAGLVRQRVAIVVKAGYGDTLIESGYRSLIAHAEIDWKPSDTISAKFGYGRNFDGVSGPHVFFADDRVYLTAQALVAGRFTLRGEAKADFIAFGGAAGRFDRNFILGLRGDYDILAWLRAGLGYTFTHHDAENGPPGALYDRHEVGARVFAEY